MLLVIAFAASARIGLCRSGACWYRPLPDRHLKHTHSTESGISHRCRGFSIPDVVLGGPNLSILFRSYTLRDPAWFRPRLGLGATRRVRCGERGARYGAATIQERRPEMVRS